MPATPQATAPPKQADASSAKLSPPSGPDATTPHPIPTRPVPSAIPIITQKNTAPSLAEVESGTPRTTERAASSCELRSLWRTRYQRRVGMAESEAGDALLLGGTGENACAEGPWCYPVSSWRRSGVAGECRGFVSRLPFLAVKPAPHGTDDVDALIARSKREVYTSSHGKPDQDRATRKGDTHGSV